MPQSLGHVVYIFKDKLTSDANRTDCHNMAMALRSPRPAQLQPASTAERPRVVWTAPDKDLLARAMGTRVKDAREKIGLTQEEMADRLGLRQSKYSKYENRGGRQPPTPMPHIFLARFAEITGANLKELLKDPR